MGVLYIVATPIGNLNDLTPRAIDTLKEADYILVEDTRQTIKLLNHFNIKNKMVSYHKFNEKERTSEIILDLKNGKNIALVSDAGTPCISDPGYILVKEALENNITVLGVPGCSAVITALSIGGLDTSSFTFYGFVPTENKPRKELFNDVIHSRVKTKVLYESPKRIIKLLSDLKNEIPGSVVSVCSELTKLHESCVHGKIEDVYNKIKENPNNLKGEYVVLISNDALDIREDDQFTIEAQLIDLMIKNKVSIKEAVSLLKKQNDKLSKKEIYNASLRLKQVLK